MPTVLVPSLDERAIAAAELERSGIVFVAREIGSDGKYLGVDPELPRSLLHDGAADVAIVEADGARHRPLKAPAEHEPVMPSGVDVVCPMAGLDALDRQLDEDAVHRAELLGALLRALPGAGRPESTPRIVTPEVIAAALTSPNGGFKGIPDDASVCPILNKVSWSGDAAVDPALRTAGLILAARPGRIDRVLVTDIRTRLLLQVELQAELPPGTPGSRG